METVKLSKPVMVHGKIVKAVLSQQEDGSVEIYAAVGDPITCSHWDGAEFAPEFLNALELSVFRFLYSK